MKLRQLILIVMNNIFWEIICIISRTESHIQVLFNLAALGVILDQNCVWLLDTALDDLFLQKRCFTKTSVNML